MTESAMNDDWHSEAGRVSLTVPRNRKTGWDLCHKTCHDESLGNGLVGTRRHSRELLEAVRRRSEEETGLDVSKADGVIFTYRRINPMRVTITVDVYRFM